MRKTEQKLTVKEQKNALKLIAKDSANYQAWQSLCIYYWQQKDTSNFAKSAEWLTLTREYYAPEVIEYLCFYYYQNKEYTRLLMLLDKHKTKPLSVDSYFLKGKACIMVKLFVEAEVLFEAVTSMAPEWADAWLEKGKAHLMLEQFAESKKDFEKAAELKPGMAEAQYGIALSMIKSGDHTLQPCSYLKRAKELGYKDPNNYFDNHCQDFFK